MQLTSEHEELILEPYNYLTQQTGKQIRSQLMEAFDHWIRVPQQDLAAIKNVVEMLHNASLLVDDVEDGSTLRRGLPVAHSIYGVASTINCANYVYFLALQQLSSLKNYAEAVSIYAEELANLHRGQGLDIYWRDSVTCPTESEYLMMIRHKTGGLLRLAVKLMMSSAGSKDDYVPLVNTIGELYQVRDDYINLTSTEYMQNKSYCEDFSEGKFSFPIIHSIRSSVDRQLLNILKQRPTDKELKSYAVSLMQKTKSFEYTVEYLKAVDQIANTQVKALGGNQQLTVILDALMKDIK